MSTKTIELNDGNCMPLLGLGVWQSDNGQETIDAVHWALDAGYRQVDTASIYKNEEAVGTALQTASLPRDQVWLTTKIWNEDIRQRRTTAALEEGLKRLNTDYIDLLLLHWPVEGSPEAWKELERAVTAGKVRSIGLSNFTAADIEAIQKIAEITPAVNQIEYHPYLIQSDIISASDAIGAVITAWSPLMQGNFLNEPLFAKIGKGYGKSAAQVVLRWCIQNDVVTIPKSTNQGRIRENGDLFDFELSEEDMQAIDALERGQRFGPDPANFDF